MRQALEKEREVGGRLRVRRWRVAGTRPLVGGEGAHHALELAWVYEGRATYAMAGQRFEVGPGQLVVVPAGVDHATTVHAQTRAGSLWLAAEAVAGLADRLGRSAALEAGLAHHGPALITLAQLVHDEAFSDDLGALMGADALSEALAIRLLRGQPRAGGAGPRSPGVRRAVERIERGYAEPLTLDQLARLAAMSRFHFSRSFHQQVGQSPYAYLTRVRLQRAAELLGRGRAAVTEAAYACGFTDLGRFGRKFRARFGCTPSQFARARAC